MNFSTNWLSLGTVNDGSLNCDLRVADGIFDKCPSELETCMTLAFFFKIGKRMSQTFKVA